MSSSQESQAPKITRRDALKALAAVTGAVVLSNLPQEWKTPIVEVGVMPAHSQGASGPAPVVSNLEGYWFSSYRPTAPSVRVNIPGCTVYTSFNYFDSLGQVSNSTTVSGTYWNQSFSGPINMCGSSGFNGSAWFQFNSTICLPQNTPISLKLLVNGRYSNVTNGTVTPEPA